MARFLKGLILVLHWMVMGSVITIVALTRYLPQNRRLLLQVLFWMFHWSGRRMEKRSGGERKIEDDEL